MKYLKIGFYGSCSVVLLLLCLLIGHLKADSPTLIISEVKVKNDATGFDEYIELYNPNIDPVSLNDYFIGYINSATPTSDQVLTKFVIAQGMLEPHKSFVLAKNDADPHLLLAVKSPFSSLSDSGGTLQISNGTGAVIDQLSWTATASVAKGNVMYLPGTTASKSQSITRARTAQNEYVVTPASWQLAMPAPESSTLLPLLPTLSDSDQADPPPELVQDPSSSNDGVKDNNPATPDILATSGASGDVTITEMLPNPAAPATDEADEYIELHNQSTESVNLKDYKLQSGNNFTYSYVFPDHVIAADAYEAFKVSVTHLLLSNSGGRSRLLNVSGEVVAQTDIYGAAAAGKAWALVDDAWQWSDTPTPGAANVASPQTVTTKAVKVATTKISKPKTTAAKPKTATKAKTPAAAKKSTASKATTKGPLAGVKNVAALHPLILAGVGVSTVLYGLYEYRQDIINTLQRLRRNRSFRRGPRASVEGTGSD